MTLVNSIYGLNQVYSNIKKQQNNLSKPPVLNQASQMPDFKSIKANFIPFLGTTQNAGIDTSSVDEIIKHFDQNTKEIWDKAIDIAAKNRSAELKTTHFINAAASLARDHRYKDLKDGLTPLMNVANKINSTLFNDVNNDFQFEGELGRLIRLTNRTISHLPKNKGHEMKVSVEFADMLEKAQKTVSKQWDGSNNEISAEYLLLKLLSVKSSDPSYDKHFATAFRERVGYIGNEPTDIHGNSTLTPPLTPIPSDETARTGREKLIKKYPRASILKQPENNLSKQAEINLNEAAESGKLTDFEHYARPAKDVANVVSRRTGKNINFIYEPGSKPEFIAYKFANMINKGELPGLKSDTTEAIFWDLNKIDFGENGNNIMDKLSNLAAESNADGKQRVIFMKDFHLFLKKFDASKFFNANELGNNVKIVGLIQEDIYKEITALEHDQKRAMDLQWQNHFEEVNLISPSASETKTMLGQEKSLVSEVLSGYPNKVTISPEVIEEIVDVAGTSRSNSFPGKALDLLDLILASKISENGFEDITLTKEDVSKFLKTHPDFKQSPQSDQNQFTLQTDTGIRLKDVGGVSQAKEVIEELIDFIKNPEKFSATGAKIPKGVLLHGSPGNGKTYLAKAIAGEAKVPFISVSGSEFVEKYVGVGASRVRDLFNFARKQAEANADPATGKKGTAIIFIDEFDALAKTRGRRSDGGSDESDQTLNQLLVEMDGMKPSDNINIVVLAATNRVDILDPAISDRPGRFDHKIEVPNPANDPDARFEILSIHARGKKFAGDKEEVLKEMADRTAGSSGARLADIINKAATMAAKDNRSEITINDLIEAKLESLVGRVKKAGKPDPAVEVIVAHECGHALVSQTMQDLMEKAWQKGRQIDLITTDSRGSYGGAVWFNPGDSMINSFESLMSELATDYGGHAVEKFLYDIQGSSGISQDLEDASKMAEAAITKWGMGPNVKGVSVQASPLIADVMKDDFKKDLKLLLNAASMISDMIVKTQEDFIRQYVDKYKANAGKGGNNLSGKEFKAQLDEWIETSGIRPKLDEAISNIRSIIETTKKGETWKEPVSDEDLKKYIL